MKLDPRTESSRLRAELLPSIISHITGLDRRTEGRIPLAGAADEIARRVEQAACEVLERRVGEATPVPGPWPVCDACFGRAGQRPEQEDE